MVMLTEKEQEFCMQNFFMYELRGKAFGEYFYCEKLKMKKKNTYACRNSYRVNMNCSGLDKRQKFRMGT